LGMYRIQYKTSYPLGMGESGEGKKWTIIIWICPYPPQWVWLRARAPIAWTDGDVARSCPAPAVLAWLVVVVVPALHICIAC
jgi:hypothetical protein